ncbi:hypothetical protein ABPG72_005441 [Tetrahymena utriculariae]
MSLAAAFKKFTNEKSSMDVKIYLSVLKESGVLNYKVQADQAENYFNTIKNNPNLRGISYQQFEQCLSQIALKNAQTKQLVEGMVLEYSKKLGAKKSDPKRFFYDKSTYTGVHNNGGPSTLDNNGISHLSQLCDRSGANVRGVKF